MSSGLDHIDNAGRNASLSKRKDFLLSFVLLAAGAFLFPIGAANKATADGSQASGPELVSIDPPQKYTPQPTRIQHLRLEPDNSLTVLLSQGTRVEEWNLGVNSEDFSLSVEPGLVKSGDFLGDGDSVITASPLQICVADLKRGTRKQIETKDINAWPFSSLSNGLCAWTELEGGGNVVKVVEFGEAFDRTIALTGYDNAFDLSLSPDGTLIAISLTRNVVEVHPLTANSESNLSLLLPLPTTLPTEPRPLGDLYKDHPRFILPTFGAANLVRFSPDSKRLVAANEFGIFVYDLGHTQTPAFLSGHDGRVSALAFDLQGNFFSAGEDKRVIMWKKGETNGTEIAKVPEIPSEIEVRADGKFIALAFPTGAVEVWNTEKHNKALTVRFFPTEGGWFAVTPDGLFDTCEGGWRHLAWGFPGGPTNTLPIESYFRDYYQERLIPKVLAEAELLPVEPVSSTRPTLPKISLAVIDTKSVEYKLSPSGMKLVPEHIRFKLDVSPLPDGTPQKDLQVSHNGIVVRKWLGPVDFQNGICSKEFSLDMFPWENRVAASVFATNELRSEEAVWERPMQGYAYQMPYVTLHVVSIGVSETRNRNFHLDFADSDAEALASVFSLTTNQLMAMGRRLQDWNNAKSMRLLSAFKWQIMPNQVDVTKLTGQSATHDAVLNLIGAVVKRAEPADTFIFYFSGHGMAQKGERGQKDRYYLVPSDANLPGELSPRTGLPEGFDGEAANLISDSELQVALQDLDVSHSAIILDACNSGSALKGFDVGPLFDPDGLGRLVYEKGANLLAASTSEGVADESSKLGHSYLNYALIHDGLGLHLADCSPQDGVIELREWLVYGEKRAKELAEAEKHHSKGAELAPRLIPERDSLILWIAEKQP